MEVSEFLQPPREIECIEELIQKAEKFESVTKKIQNPEITMKDVRILFDCLISDFPSMASYISPDANIAHSPDFENGIEGFFVASLWISVIKRMATDSLKKRAFSMKMVRTRMPTYCSQLRPVKTNLGL